jgi:hypothetical protein
MNDANLSSPTREAQSDGRPIAVATPIQSIEVVNELVRVMYTYKRSVMYKDLESLVQYHPANISQGLSATRDLGITRLSGGKGHYVLTEKGEDYARLITANKEAEARDCLKEIIESNPAWTDILLFLKATRGQARDPLDLVLDIERRLNKKWSPSMRNRLRASYVSLLGYAGLLQKEGSKMISLVETTEEKKQTINIVEETSPSRSLLGAQQASSESKDFARLQTEDFGFEVRKNVHVIDFAKAQFLAWIEYLKKRIAEDNTSVSTVR